MVKACLTKVFMGGVSEWERLFFLQSFNLEDSISYCLKEMSHLVATQCYSGRMNHAIFEMLALL